MDILPAIDLRNGQCVRLLQGDYDRQINYNDDPLAQARLFENDGARYLHVVDLDGARDGSASNHGVIRQLAENTRLKLEVGGGIRSEETVTLLLECGVERTVLGTRALEDIDWFEGLVSRHPGRIVLGLDARDGKISTRGWTKDSDITVEHMARVVNDWPLAAIVYTDIARDGMLTGPNIEATNELAQSCRVPVIASGGVSKLDDIERLVQLPIMGIITGRALYENTLKLKDALAVAEEASRTA